MNRKAYIFLLDGIIAIVILTVGFLLISSTKPTHSTEIPLSIVADNTMSLFSNVRMYELCDFSTCNCANDKLEEHCEQDYIENRNQTLLDYFGELYYKYELGDPIYRHRASELFKNVTQENKLLRQEVFGVEFNIKEDRIYYNAENKDSSPDLISAKRVIFGYYEEPSSGIIRYWGPYVAEVNIWQK